jgi:predicted DCC family thiol-disulfide oxidoreductase YuxK
LDAVVLCPVPGLCDPQNDSRRGSLPLFRLASLKNKDGQAVANYYNVPDEFKVALESIVVIEPRMDGSHVLRTRSDAVLTILDGLTWPYPLLGVFRVVPRPILDAVYDVVAKSRYKFVRPFSGGCMNVACCA